MGRFRHLRSSRASAAAAPLDPPQYSASSASVLAVSFAVQFVGRRITTDVTIGSSQSVVVAVGWLKAVTMGSRMLSMSREIRVIANLCPLGEKYPWCVSPGPRLHVGEARCDTLDERLWRARQTAGTELGSTAALLTLPT